jgi:hypothetical protein
VYLSMCREFTTTHLRIISGTNVGCLRNIDLSSHRIVLLIIHIDGRLSSSALLCTYEGYHSKVTNHSKKTMNQRLCFCVRLENEWINDEYEKLFARFITVLGDFTYAGYQELKLANRPETLIDIPTFIMPQPKKTGRTRS